MYDTARRHIGHVEGRLGLQRAIGLRYAAGHACRHRRRGVADVDLTAGDSVRPAIEGDRLGEPGDGVLGRGVRRRVRAWRVGGDRTVVDDATTCRRLALHETDRLLRAQERAGEVHVDDSLPLREREVFERHRRCAHAGVVEQHIQPAEVVRDRVEQRGDRLGDGDIGGHGQRTSIAAGGVHQLRRLFQRFQPAAGEPDVEAVDGELDRHCPPDARSCTCHHRDLHGSHRRSRDGRPPA